MWPGGKTGCGLEVLFPRTDPGLRAQGMGCSPGTDPSNGCECTDLKSLLWHSRPLPPLFPLPPDGHLCAAVSHVS